MVAVNLFIFYFWVAKICSSFSPKTYSLEGFPLKREKLQETTRVLMKSASSTEHGALIHVAAVFVWERDHLRMIFLIVTWETTTSPFTVTVGGNPHKSMTLHVNLPRVIDFTPLSYRAFTFSPSCYYWWCSCSTKAQNLLISTRQNCSYCSVSYLAAAPIYGTFGFLFPRKTFMIWTHCRISSSHLPFFFFWKIQMKCAHHHQKHLNIL